jgi:small-conductance mechanosensitive channel
LARFLTALATATLVATATHGAAQTAPTTESEEADRAPVTLDGFVLFRVLGFSGGEPANVRAAAIADRIARAAADPTITPADIRIVEDEGRLVLQARDDRLMVVTERDSRVIGARPRTIAEYCRDRTVSAIEGFRAERQAGVILRRVAVAGVATALLVVLLWATNRLTYTLDARVRAFWHARIETAEHQALQLVRLERLHALGLGGLRLLRALIGVMLVGLFVEYVFGLFPWTRPISQNVLSIVLGPLEEMALGLLRFIPNLVFLVVLAVVVRHLLRLARAGFDAVEHGTLPVANFEPEWAQPTFRIVRGLILAFALVVAYPYLPGSGSDAFKGVSIFLGLVFSLGSTSALSNIIAGYSLTYRRAFRIGDRIQIGDAVGDVTAVRMQVTHLRSLKNEEIIIPNSNILGANVVNYSRLARERGLILHTEVGIGYETPWRQVEAMLLEAARRTRGLLADPPPFVHQRRLGDFAVGYELNAYCDDPHGQLELYTQLHRNILDVFNEYGVQIMTPAYEKDPEAPKVVPKDQWFQPPAAARRADGPDAG